MRRLTILIAAVGALLLIPAASALALTPGTVTVNAVAGSGSGEVNGVGGAAKYEGLSGLFESSPPIECKAPPKAGTCTATMYNYEEIAGAALLEAIPSIGSELTGWNVTFQEEEGEVGGGCTLEKEYDMYLCLPFAYGEADAEVSATFADEPGEPVVINLEEGAGTVVSNPAGIECSNAPSVHQGKPKTCWKSYESGKVTLTASPAPGYAFKGWKGCETGGAVGRQCTVTAGTTKTVGAKFYKVWRLKATKSNGQGIFSTSPGGVNCGYGCLSSAADYKEGSLTLKTKPAKHFHFVEFKGGTNAATSCNGVKTETCTIALFNADSAIEEVYAEDAKNTLTLTKEGGGQGFIKTKPTNINCGYTCASAKAEFYAAETPEVTVVLNKGTTSVTWVKGAGTCTGKVLTCSVPMSSSAELVAKFD